MEPINNSFPARPADVQAANDAEYNCVTTMIQCYVESVGLTKERTHNPTNKNWLWKKGSASIELFIDTIVFANNLLGFYRHLLELNNQRLGVKLGIMPNAQTV